MANNFENRIAKNRTSPKNEALLNAMYHEMNPRSKKNDGLDIAAVITKDGTRGRGLLSEELNRSRDNKYHRVIDFIPDSELKKKAKA